MHGHAKQKNADGSNLIANYALYTGQEEQQSKHGVHQTFFN